MKGILGWLFQSTQTSSNINNYYSKMPTCLDTRPRIPPFHNAITKKKITTFIKIQGPNKCLLLREIFLVVHTIIDFSLPETLKFLKL